MASQSACFSLEFSLEPGMERPFAVDTLDDAHGVDAATVLHAAIARVGRRPGLAGAVYKACMAMDDPSVRRVEIGIDPHLTLIAAKSA